MHYLWGVERPIGHGSGSECPGNRGVRGETVERTHVYHLTFAAPEEPVEVVGESRGGAWEWGRP
jgi:hypothetical protein